MLGESKVDKFEVSLSVVHMGTNQRLFENTEHVKHQPPL